MPSRAEARAKRLIDAARAIEDAQIKEQTKADAFVAQFVAITPEQIATWIDGNITTLPAARDLLKKIALMLLLMARDKYRD